MSVAQTSVLEELLRENALGWAIDWYSQPSEAIARYRDTLDKASRTFADGTQLSESRLGDERQQNPHKVAAFLQALVSSRSAKMLAMVWRILHDWRIHEVEMTYRDTERFRLKVVLTSPDKRWETYESIDIQDATLLRHFGVATLDGKPVFDGFYALRLEGSEQV